MGIETQHLCRPFRGPVTSESEVSRKQEVSWSTEQVRLLWLALFISCWKFVLNRDFVEKKIPSCIMTISQRACGLTESTDKVRF